MRFFVITLLLVTALVVSGSSQNIGKLLLIANDTCELAIDGQENFILVPATPLVIELETGQHLLQNKTNGQQQIVEIESQKQLVLDLTDQNLTASVKTPQLEQSEARTERIAELELSIPGGFSLGADALNGGDYYSAGIPVFLYYFQKDDVITLNVERLQKKGTFSIEVYSYPDGTKVFSTDAFEGLNDKAFTVINDGIYIIEIGTNYTFDRRVGYTLDRWVANTEGYKSAQVIKQRSYELKSLQEPMVSWVNSTSNETWKGGKAELSIPINLPPNTLEWYYVFTASRSAEETRQVMANVDLAGELGSALLGISGPVLSLGLDLITAPPGANYCDVFLLDATNAQLLRSDQPFSYWPEGSRQNVSSGKILVSHSYGSALYLGIRNLDTFHGISVGLEIVALTFREFYQQADE